MPLLDLTDLMSDPDFCDDLTIYRRPYALVDGRSIVMPSLVSPAPTGSIQPGANPDILRTMDFQTNEQVITVWTEFPLYDAQEGYFPDIVMFEDAPYEVVSCNSWTAWGGGWRMAICKSVVSVEPAG